jgi:hypothetical protein
LVFAIVADKETRWLFGTGGAARRRHHTGLRFEEVTARVSGSSWCLCGFEVGI